MITSSLTRQCSQRDTHFLHTQLSLEGPSSALALKGHPLLREQPGDDQRSTAKAVVYSILLPFNKAMLVPDNVHEVHIAGLKRIPDLHKLANFQGATL